MMSKNLVFVYAKERLEYLQFEKAQLQLNYFGPLDVWCDSYVLKASFGSCQG